MNYEKQTSFRRGLALMPALLALVAVPVFAQYDAPPLAGPAQLDSLVNRIALYPDPLLAQVLAASTYPDQIADAARFADDNRSLNGDQLADVIAQANLPFDPSVQALIPFPDVLDMLASDMNWTGALGNAVLAQRPDVMDAVQRMRSLAQRYGYLQSNGQEQVVADPGYISIMPVNPAYVYVPVYDPYVVFAPPRPGFFVGGAISFRTGYFIGARFGTWGWGGGFNWGAHAVVVNHAVWNRTWVNRQSYAHNYGNWNNGHWAHTDGRTPVIVNRPVVVNRNTTVNRYANENNNRNAYRPAQTNNNYVPNRGNERQQFERPAPQANNNYVPNRGNERQQFERPAPQANNNYVPNRGNERQQFQRPAPQANNYVPNRGNERQQTARPAPQTNNFVPNRGNERQQFARPEAPRTERPAARENHDNHERGGGGRHER